MPPRRNQIESRTKPPPAVSTQLMSAAHSITPPSLWDYPRLFPRAESALYTVRTSLSTTARLLSKNQLDPTVRGVALARGRGLARNCLCVAGSQRRCDEARPHASVEHRQLRIGTHEWSQWTGRRRYDRAATLEFADRSL